MRSKFSLATLALLGALSASAQSLAASDPVLNTVESYAGRALILRCFCADNNLAFDAAGKLAAIGKTTDWTLAGFNLQKVERKAPGTLQLEGVRVAIRFVPDRKEFERHPQNDVKIRITLPEAADARRMDEAMAGIFSVGIDPALQRSMPPYWQHYFNPKLEWPRDELDGQSIYAFYGPSKPGAASAPSVEHRVDSGYTNEAQHDRVRGTVQLRLVVDTNGQARRIAISQPLGYGLDEKAVESMAKFRFHPATDAGKPVPSMVLLQEEYAPVPQPQR